jgi:hypothetical protein
LAACLNIIIEKPHDKPTILISEHYEEGEIWSRIAQTRIISLVQLNSMDEALRLEEDLTKYYYARRKVDPWTLYALNVLRRRSEPLHRLPVATQRLENALEFFGSLHSNAMPRHSIQYYYALNNLVANLLASARFDDASRHATELDELVNKYPLPWPSLEVPANNFVLAGFLSGKLSAEIAVQMMSKVQVDPPNSEDNQDKLLYASGDSSTPTHNPLVPAWVEGAMDNSPGNRSNWDPTFDIPNSPMWPYCTNAYDIWRCPSDPSYVVVNGAARPRVRSISMNVCLGGFAGTDGGWGWATKFRLFLKAIDLTAPGPAKTFVFLEMRPDSINWPDFQTEMSGYPDQPALYQFNTDYPNMVHDLACNFSFADGPAETHRWLDPRTVPPPFGTQMPDSLAVPGDPDIAWLQDHATRPK